MCLSQKPRVEFVKTVRFSVGDFLTVMFNTVDCRLFRDTKYFFLQKFLFVRYDKSAVSSKSYLQYRSVSGICLHMHREGVLVVEQCDLNESCFA